MYTMTMMYLSSIDQSTGKVDQASYHSPCSVNTKTIQDKSVCNTPPEQGGSTCEVLGIVSDVLGHKDHDQNVGNGDAEEEDAG